MRLPRYVSAFKDRHGKTRYRYRRKGVSAYLYSKPGTPAFYRELAELADSKPGIVPGTFDDLIDRYYNSTRWTVAERTAYVYKGLYTRFQMQHGHRLVEEMRTVDVDKYLATLAPTTANRMRKLLIAILDYAIKLEWIDRNPAEAADRRKVKTIGFHSWSDAELAAFDARWPVGTKARLAKDLLFYTGQRRGDMVLWTADNIRNGWLHFTQGKTGKVMAIPIHPELQRTLDASELGIHTLLENSRGPFTSNSFGNWFRDRCDDAGLSQCTAHGLRKALARTLAESGASNQGIKAVGGWSGDKEVATYTKAVDQARLAEAMIKKISG